MSGRRSRSRSERRGHHQGLHLRYITSRHKAYSALLIDATEIGPDVLSQVTTWAHNILEVTLAEVVADFPHHLDGGWQDADPNDNFLLYATIQTGQFKGVSACAIGGNKQVRERGVCLALILAVAVAYPDIVTDEILQQYHAELPSWAAQVHRMHMLVEQNAKPSSKPRSRPRSKSHDEACMNLKVKALVDENADLRREVAKLRKEARPCG